MEEPKLSQAQMEHMTIFETLSPEQQSLILEHLKLVEEANKHVNLTRIVNEQEAMLLHVEDSLIGLQELEDSPRGLLGDLGSGAGFPGIPLAIASGRETVLIDARMKKMETVEGIIRKLGMSPQVSTYAGRAELLARKKAGSFAVLTARALSKLPVLLELASPLLEMNGRLICYKAQLDREELDNAKRVRKMTGMRLVSDRETTLGDEYKRRIVVFEKAAKPTVKLPRQERQAQKDPL